MGDEPPHLFSGHTVLPGPDFHRLDRASFAWRTRKELYDSKVAPSVQAPKGISSLLVQKCC